MFGNGYKPKSTTKKAKGMIRGEIRSFYGRSQTGERKLAIDSMKADAEAAGRGIYGDWNKGSHLVDTGNFRCYYDDQSKFLNKIYGKKQVDKMSGDKIHKTYAGLIGREYAAMLREKNKRKSFKKKGRK